MMNTVQSCIVPYNVLADQTPNRSINNGNQVFRLRQPQEPLRRSSNNDLVPIMSQTGPSQKNVTDQSECSPRASNGGAFIKE